MPATAKVSQRGQVAIPKEIRDRYHIKEGDSLVFEERADGFYVHAVADLLSFRGILPKIPVPIEQAIDESMEEESR